MNQVDQRPHLAARKTNGPGPARASTSRGSRALAILLLVGLTAALAGAGYSRYLAHRAKQLADVDLAKKQGRPIPIRTETIGREIYKQVVGATMLTEASGQASIRFGGAELAGRPLVMAKVLVREGQKVEAGQMLFEADAQLFTLTLKQKQSAEAAAEAEFEAVKNLHDRRGASGLEVRAAKIKYELAQLETKFAQQSLDACRIVSPLDGYVDLIEIVPGEQLESGVELTTVHQLDPIHARVDLPQECGAEVQVGDAAEVVVDSLAQETFTGTVTAISPAVDPETRVLAVVVEIANPDGRIKAGVSGFARFRSEKTGLIVPDTAIVQLSGEASTFVVVDGRAQLRHIRTGPLVETGRRLVLEGLAAADQVVVYGQQDLSDGDAVNTNWRKWTRRE